MRRRRTAIACLLVAALATAACGRGSGSGSTNETTSGGLVAPTTTSSTGGDQAERPLGFPALATKNTTRIGGSDPAADAAAVALAVYPSTSPATRPRAVALVDARDWRNGIAAAVLAGAPVHAAILLSDGERMPPATQAALQALQPAGSSAAGGAQVIRVGDAAGPPGLKTTQVTARDPIALARALDAFQAAAAGQPSDAVIVVSADDPAFAMPAAGYAAKGGAPVLYVHRDRVPAETRAALRAHRKPSIYILGPRPVVGPKAVRELRRLGTVKRIGADEPAASSVAFARFIDPGFGWGVVDPGHGLVFARSDRPLDAAAAASLSDSGTYGPLLVVTAPDRLDDPVAQYLLDIQPGYRRDPVRGVYNHGWIVGDDRAISVDTQSRIDDLLEIRRFRGAR
jgi:hypothetical protein